jgi:membrane fusion protein (multidrug efflux system)
MLRPGLRPHARPRRGLAPRTALALARTPLAALALAVATGCGGPDAGPPGSEADEGPAAAVVELVTVRPELLRNLVAIPGQLASEYSVVVRPELETVLESIGFAEGERVEKGRVLFSLRDDQQRAEVAEAEASLALAAATHRRTSTLQRQDVSSAAALERAAAELAVARAQVEVARVELERTQIRAPFDGLMGALLVSPGDRLRRSTDLVQIDAIDRLQLLFYLPESAVALVRPGIPVRVAVAPFPGERFDGEIYFVAPTLEPEGRRVLVKAWVPNQGRRLRPGLFAEIEAEVDRRDDALLVPDSALVSDLEGTYVWKVDGDSRAQRAPVELGLRQEGRVEVAKGLAPGDTVVAAGIHKVKVGQRVRAAEGGETSPVAAERKEPPARSPSS